MASSNHTADAPSPSDELAELAARATAEQGASPAAGEEASEAVALLFLRVGRRWFSVRSETVREVIAKGYVTRVPTAPAYVLGVTLVRGRLVPVLALEGLLGSVGTGDVAQTLPRLVVLRHEDTEVALVADETRGVFELRLDTGADHTRASDRARYLGTEFDWEGRVVCMLDVPTLIAEATPGAPAAT